MAKLFGGVHVPGSGALGEPGDVKTRELLIECKATDPETRTYGLELWRVEKICEEAEGENRTPAIVLELNGLEAGIERDWVLLPLRVVQALLRKKECRTCSATSAVAS